MQKRGFSLIELMIVIVIIGVVYSLVISKIKAPKESPPQPSFENLKSYLLFFSKDHKSVKLLCENECDKCAIYSDNKKLSDLKSFFDSSVEFYRYDYFLGDVALSRQNCFEFSVDGDGVSDQVIIRYKDRVYDYTLYFAEVKVYDSLQELNDAKEKLISDIE